MFDSFPRVRGKGTLEAKQKVGMGQWFKAPPPQPSPAQTARKGGGKYCRECII
jgi:hypothetical protein